MEQTDRELKKYTKGNNSGNGYPLKTMQCIQNRKNQKLKNHRMDKNKTNNFGRCLKKGNQYGMDILKE